MWCCKEEGATEEQIRSSERTNAIGARLQHTGLKCDATMMTRKQQDDGETMNRMKGEVLWEVHEVGTIAPAAC